MPNELPGGVPATNAQPLAQPSVPAPVVTAPVAAPAQPVPTPVAAPAPVAAPVPVAAPAPVSQPASVQQPAPQPAPVQQPAPQPAPVQKPASAPQSTVQAVPQRPGVPARPGQPLHPNTAATRKPPNPKKLLVGCTGCFGAAVVFFIMFVLIFVSQTTATGENQLAKSLGVDTATFINTLILLVNLVFGIISVGLFILAIVGIFRLMMARKDDKDAKRKGLVLAGISGLLLLLFVGIWVGIYLFISPKQVRVQKVNNVVGIITDPVETLGLTAPVTIKFDGSKLPIDEKKYDILSYLWSFGDGQTSTVSIASHTYNNKGDNNGRFDVSLVVTKRDKTTKAETTDTYSTTVTIANVELNATFTATPENGPAPLTVAFDASASAAPAGEIVSFEWDFDNNQTFGDAVGVTATHTFDQLGKYKVNLRITDNTGQFKVFTKEITVAEPNTPVGVINIPTQTGKYFAGIQYSFQGDKSTSPTGTVEKYEWDFGDGSAKANTRTATHTYKTPGSYEVILKVTDDSGAAGESTLTVKVETQESSPIAVIETVPAPVKDQDYITGAVPFEVMFDGSKSADPDNNIVDYKWDFDGDGTDDSAGAKASYVYKEAGMFNATLTVIDAENNISKATIVVKAGSQPLAARIVATPVEGVVPLTVTFDASSSSYPSGQIVSYEWDFGDGSAKRIDVAKVTYKYTKIGTFTAKVTAIASDNSRSTAETPVNIRPVPLAACFESSVEQGPAPLTVEFDPRCSTGTIAKYSWDFGDTQTSRTRKPSHTFETPGSYQVNLEVSDNQNVLNTFTKTILVTGTI